MITLEEAIRIGYRSAAIGCSSAKHKKKLSRELESHFRDECDIYTTKTPEWEAAREKALMCNDLTVAYHYHYKFFSLNAVGTGMGVKGWLEKIWEYMGNNVEELTPIWDKYQRIGVFEALTFKEVPTFDVDEMEEEYNPPPFTVEMSWDERYIILLDSLTRDTWREEAMRRWLMNNVEIDGSGNSDAYMLWLGVLDYAGQFFEEATTCMSDCNARVSFVLHPDARDREMEIRQKIADKYDYDRYENLVAAGGVFIASYNELPEEWKQKIDIVPVFYED
jgi:hypothetical protein